MHNRLITSLLFASFLGASTAAMADETLNFLGSGNADVFDIQYGNLNEDVYVGALYFTSSNDPNTFALYCVDLNHDIWAGDSYNVETVGTESLPQDSVYRLAGDIYDANIQGVSNADESAALQIALWDAVAPGQFTIYAPQNVMDMAAADYAAGLNYNGPATFYQEVNGDGQSQIGAAPGPDSALVLIVSTLGGALLKKRRK